MRHAPALPAIGYAALVVLAALALPSRAAAQGHECMGGPCVTITPLDSVVNRVLYPAADTVLQVEVTYCSDIAIDWSSRRIYLNNIDVTSTFTHSYTYGMCIYGGRSNRSLALSRESEGLSQLSVMVENVNGYLGGASVWYRYIWPGYTAPSIVLGVSPERFTRFPQPGAADSSIFTVVNLGNRPLTANLTPVCRQGVTCANPTGAPSSVSLDTLSGSRTQTVVVRYNAGAAGDTGSVTLRAVHTSYTTVRDSALTDIMVVTPTPQRPAGVVVAAAPRVLARHLCVTASAGGGFASALRSILRQDPDVIMIGEMRDPETAEIAIQSAMTGHLVFSTLHTNDSLSAVPRLMDLGVPAYLVAATVEGILAQRLVRRICDGCRASYSPDPERLALIAARPVGRARLERGTGCAACRGTGFSGRVGLFEFLIMTDEIRDAVTRGASRAELRCLAEANGWRTLRTDAMAKVDTGITTVEEVLRVL